MKFEYTVTGKTVEDAYTKAVSLYSSIGEIVNSTVISEGKKGFLGIFGAQPAEITVVIDDGKPEKKQDKKADKKPEKKPEAKTDKPQGEKKADKPQAEKPAKQQPKKNNPPKKKQVNEKVASRHKKMLTK